MASGSWRQFQEIVEIWRRMCVSRVMDALGDGAEGLEGAHYIMFLVWLLSLKKKNITASINPAIFWQTPISTHRKPTHAHPSSTWKCTKSKLWAGTLLLGGTAPLNILCICIVSAAGLTWFTLPVGLFYSAWAALGEPSLLICFWLCNRNPRKGAASAR